METIFMPPYVSPDWQNFTYVNISPYLWVAYRHKPLTGEIVMQMGTNPGSRSEQIGVLKIGFQRTYRTSAARDERWAAEFKNGPVTIKGPNQVDICRNEISLKGPGIDDFGAEDAHSYDQRRIYVRGDGRANATYTLTVYGHIQISFSPNETAYSEIITKFLQVWYVPEPPESPSREAPDPRLSALKPVKPVLRKITIEEATRAGEAGFEGGSEPPPKRGPRRKS